MSEKNKGYKPYIGRPKPMKAKKEFHKPTTGFYIGLGIFVVLAIFIGILAYKLYKSSKVVENEIERVKLDEENEDYLTIENEYLRLEMLVKERDGDNVPTANPTNFKITNLANDYVWSSNPHEIEKQPSNLEKQLALSTLLVKYSTENGVENTLNSSKYAVESLYYDVEKVSDTEIDVHYSVTTAPRVQLFPSAIFEEEMDSYMEEMSSGDVKLIERVYNSIDDLLRKEMITEEVYDAVYEKYPDMTYIDEDDGEEYPQTIWVINDSIQAYQKEQLATIFYNGGYTEEDSDRHNALYSEIIGETTVKLYPTFNITVKYILDGKDFVVEIPYDEIEFYRAYPITQLSVLPYFGAASANDEGFMFVPEGGGSLINFNNGKVNQTSYYADVYGWDYATERSAVNNETRVQYPVFGMSYGGNSFISIIEDGSEYAGINAEISGKSNSSNNNVYASYKMVHGEQFEVSTRNTSAQWVYEDGLPAGEKIRQVYKFVSDEEDDEDTPDYVKMAFLYRDYLVNTKNIGKKLENGSTPVAVELIGAIDKVQQVLGMPKNKPYELTSYKAAGEIIKQIDELGIKNASIKLSGFINSGVRQKMMNSVKYISELGGKRGFKKMLKSLADSDSKLYLDGSLQYAYKADLFSGFNRYSDPARFASDEVCKLYEYSPVWYGKLKETDPYYLLSPKNIDKSSEKFNKAVSKLDIAGISYTDNGYILSGDYNEDERVSRHAAKEQQIKRMEEANEMGMGIMINSGNDYALPYTDFVTNMPLHGNEYAITDLQVPFYQIALHGYKNYAGTPLNLAYENTQLLLEAAETGAGLYFTFMDAKESKLQETAFSQYYSSNFEGWKDRFVEIYKKYDSTVGVVKNSLITNHKYIDDKVTVTSFDNGYDIFVNFGYTDYISDDGLVIPAREYKVLKVED